MTAQQLQMLIDYKEILELKARYFRTVDEKDWAGFRAVFSDDARFLLQDGKTVDDPDIFVNAVARQLEGAVSVHRGSLPEIDFETPDRATGAWALNDFIEWKPDPETGVRRGFLGYGREYETYEKIEDAWKITHWRLHYDRQDPLPREPLPDSILRGRPLLKEGEYTVQEENI